MISKLEMDCQFTCGDIDKEGRYVMLGTKKGTIRVLDVTNVEAPRLVMIKKINLERSVQKIQISHDNQLIAILMSGARRAILISGDINDEFPFVGFAKLPGVCLDISWASSVRPPVNSTQNNKVLECVIKNGLLVAIVPPHKLTTSRQLTELSASEITSFGRKVDFDIQKLTVSGSTGDVYTAGEDRLLKRYQQPEEYLPKMDMRVKAPKNPLDELVSHDLDTVTMTFNSEGDYLITGGSEGTVVKRSIENLDDFEVFKAQNYKNGGINCLGVSAKYPLVYTGGADGSIVVIKTANFKFQTDKVVVDKGKIAKLKTMGTIMDSGDLAVLFYKRIIEDELYESKKNEKENLQTDMREKLGTIKDELHDLKKRNEDADEIEKLEIDDFCLDLPLKKQIEQDGIKKCGEIRTAAENQNIKQEVLHDKIKFMTHSKMDKALKSLTGLVSNIIVFNFTLRKRDGREKHKLAKIKELRRIEYEEKNWAQTERHEELIS
jgi:hypothetical protein